MRSTRLPPRAKALASCLLIALTLAVPARAAAAPGEIVSFPLPAGGEPAGIAVGPEGNLWFTEPGGDRIGRITLAGQVTEYPVPTALSQPFQIALGPDGNMWFTESNAGNVGRITPAGAVTEFNVCGYCRPAGITAGPDGNVWFTLPEGGGRLGSISPSGAVNEFLLSLPPNEPRGIALGPDGNFWVTDTGLVGEEPSIGQITRVTPAGAATAFRVPTPTGNFTPTAIANGPDGALWFAGGIGIGRIDTAGTFTEFPQSFFGGFDAITTGPDGNLWLTGAGPFAAEDSVDRVTTDGHLTTYPIPSGSGGIVTGPDGNLWFTEAGGNIGRISPGAPGPEIVSTQAFVRGNRARLSLFCSGGAPGTSCAGSATLTVRIRRRPPRAHGRSRGQTVQLGSRRYRIANGSEGTVKITLRSRVLNLLPRKREVRVQAVVDTGGTASARRPLALVFPRHR